MTYEIREIQKSDEDAIFLINIGVQPFPWTAGAVKSEIEMANCDSKVLVFRATNEVVGYVFVRSSGPDREILSIGLRVDHQNGGLGSRLMRELIAGAPDQTSIFLEVAESNEKAIGLYRKYGFSVFHKRNSYFGGHVNALIMKLDIA